MSILIRGMEMPENCYRCLFFRMTNEWNKNDEADILFRCARTGEETWDYSGGYLPNCPLVPVPPHGRLRRRIVYRGEVYNALESARINALDGILTDRYKDGFHDGLKKALEILANEVKDAPTIIPASEEGET